MTNQNFFRNAPVETNFFDEGPVIQCVKPNLNDGKFHNTSSIDMSAIDGWRQGVEITQQKHWDAGVVKIHAGEPGHVLRRNSFGMGKNFRGPSFFEEMDYFDPRNFIAAQDADSPLYLDIFTFPILTSDNDQLENYIFDGIIEPFTIRARASFFSIDVPFEAREVKGALMGGNTDTTLRSDQIVTKYVENYENVNIAFADQYVDQVSFVEQRQNSALVASNVGLFSIDKFPVAPFLDARVVRNDVNYNSENVENVDMLSALSIMSSSTDNYLNMTIKEKSATCGWTYDNTSVGTDSLAFGGLQY